MNEDDELLEFRRRLRVLLPETYDVFDGQVEPVSMGSAGLKFGWDGKVQWDQMWGSFCDLAMAGGPPHRGKLLEPALVGNPADEAGYKSVADELCRGLSLVTGLCAEQSSTPGWVRLYCTSAAMSGWLMRAVTMENVSAVAVGLALHLPAGPAFRLEKEIRNVITAVAKTCHYWQDHMRDEQHDRIADLLRTMEHDRPLVKPVLAPLVHAATLAYAIANRIANETGLKAELTSYAGWAGVECGAVAAAIWMMRALAVGNVLARREGTSVFLPLDPLHGGLNEESVDAVVKSHRLARLQHIL